MMSGCDRLGISLDFCTPGHTIGQLNKRQLLEAAEGDEVKRVLVTMGCSDRDILNLVNLLRACNEVGPPAALGCKIVLARPRWDGNSFNLHFAKPMLAAVTQRQTVGRYRLSTG